MKVKRSAAQYVLKSRSAEKRKGFGGKKKAK